jgi:RNA polymerase subunit RPABC4/transcription elongation factor Spt4
MEMDKAVCVGCGRDIDTAARLCPYCGADRRSGEKIDTQAILQQEFRPRETSATEGVLEYARQRQGVVIAVATLVAILIVGGVHQIIVRRNRTAVTNAAAVPLTDVTDLNSQSQETQTLPMPELQFQYDGNPQTLRTPIVEQGAIAPPQQPGGGQPPAAAKPRVVH